MKPYYQDDSVTIYHGDAAEVMPAIGNVELHDLRCSGDPCVCERVISVGNSTTHWLDELTTHQRLVLRRRLMLHVKTTDGCWEWQSYTDAHRYGRISVSTPICGKRPRLAYRVLFELDRGKTPAGMQLDHLCRNRACVRPDHLEVVTPMENFLRGLGPANRRKTACPAGHPYDEINTLVSRRGDGSPFRICRICHAEGDRRRRARRRAGA